LRLQFPGNGQAAHRRRDFAVVPSVSEASHDRMIAPFATTRKLRPLLALLAVHAGGADGRPCRKDLLCTSTRVPMENGDRAPASF
jgi:hypothetical protein